MFRSVPTAGRIVLAVFHNVYGVVLLEFISKGTTINSEGYCRTSQSRTHEFEVCPHMVQPLLQHDSAQQHTPVQLERLGILVPLLLIILRKVLT